MFVNLEISAAEPLLVLLRRVTLLYSVEHLREIYTQLKILQMAKEGPEQFCEEAIRKANYTDVEKDQVMEMFLTALYAQSLGAQREQGDE